MACCRRLLNLNQRKSHFIHQLMGTVPIHDITMYRMLGFFVAGLNHIDHLNIYFYKKCLLSNSSYMSENISRILKHFEINYCDMFSLNRNNLRYILNSMKGKQNWECNIFEKILPLREGFLISILLRRKF